MKKFSFLTYLILSTIWVKANTKIDDLKPPISIKKTEINDPSYLPTNGILYVKKGSKGNGSSWENAVGELADALLWANKNKIEKLKIFVSTGIYIPKYSPQDADNFTENPTDQRIKSFLLPNGIELYGGFDPEKDITKLEHNRILPSNNDKLIGTILSGDLDYNDELKNYENNAYHVILSSNFQEVKAKIDGFTITGGNANGFGQIFVDKTPVIKSAGAAIYTTATTQSSTITVYNTLVINNYGIGIYSISAAEKSEINLINSSVKNNFGTPIYSFSYENSHVKLLNSVLSNNSSEENASGIQIRSNNAAAYIDIINSNLINNKGISVIEFEKGKNNRLNVHNSIIYKNKQFNNSNYNNESNWLIKTGNSLEDIQNSFVQGVDLSNLDPLFTNYNDGDYSLQDTSPLIDKGNNSLYTGNLLTDKDIAGSRRLYGIIDIGAYEKSFKSALDVIKSFTRNNPSPTNSKTVSYTLEFNENVTGLDISDFNLKTLNGQVNATIESLTGAGQLYILTINNIDGDGEIRLDLNESDTNIKDEKNVLILGEYTDGETYIIDTVKPDAPTLSLDQNSDSGNSNTDKITNVTEPTFLGTTEPNATISLFRNDENTLLGTIKTSNNDWQIQSLILPEGKHNIIAIATDEAGNISLPTTLEITIDTTNPFVSNVNLPANKTYISDERLNFEINFNESLYIHDNEILKLDVNIGGITYTLEGIANNNKTSFSFSKTIDNSMLDLDGITIERLFADKTVEDFAGNLADLTLSNLQTSQILVDGRTTDLAISAATSKSKIAIGETVTFTIEVSNIGLNHAEEIIVNAILPAELKFISANNSIGNFNAQTWTLNIPNLNTNGKSLVEITAEAIKSGNYIFEANVSSKTLDSDLSNNSSVIALNSDKEIQTITFDPIGNVYFGDENIDLIATSTSALDVNFKSSDSSIAEVYQDKNDNNKWKLRAKSVGSVNITAYQEGNYLYLPSETQQNLTIQKVDLAITTFADQSFVYDGTEKSILISENLPTGVTVSYTGNNQTEVGVYPITAEIIGGNNYNNKTLTAKLAITKADLPTLTMNDNSFVYDGNAKALKINEALPNGVTVSYTGNNKTEVGVYPITAEIIGGNNYNNKNLTAILTITKADLPTFTIDNKSFVYDGNIKSLAINEIIPPGITVSFIGNNKTEVGTYQVSAELNGGNNFITKTLTAELTITKAELPTFTIDNKSFVYDGNIKSLAINETLPNGVTVSYSGNDKTEVGIYPITAQLNGGTNYNTKTLTAELTITKADLPIITMNNKSFVYDGNAKSLAINETLPNGVTVSYSGNNKTEAGIYQVTAEIIGGNNYNNKTITAELTITKADLPTITFNDKTFIYDGKPKSLEINEVLPAGVTVSYIGNNQINAGTYNVTVNISTGGNYNDNNGISLNATLTITKANQTITWNQELITGCDGVNSIVLTAKSSSGLPIVYTSSDPSVSKIENNRVIVQSLGYSKITAHQDGNENYNPAEVITEDLIQKLDGLFVQKFSDELLIFDNKSNDYVKWQWFKDGVKINGATSQFYETTNPIAGMYHVEATNKKGLTFETCPVYVGASKKESKITTTPNPSARNSNFRISSDYTIDELKNSKLIISDFSGKVISEISNFQKDMPVKTPAVSGTYIVNVFLQNGKVINTKLLVK